MKGTQQRLQCPKCGKAFFAWRPAELPGAPVKCYFCGTQFEDEAAKRKPLAPPAGVAPKPGPTPEAPQAGVAPTPAPTPETPPAGVTPVPPAAPAAPPAAAEDAAKPS